MSDDIRQLAAQLLASSRYAMPMEEARRHIAERRRKLLAASPPAPEPDFTASEPLPHPVDGASAYAASFWARKTASDLPARPTQPPGRAPKGDLSPEHDRFRVLDGGKDDGDKRP